MKTRLIVSSFEEDLGINVELKKEFKVSELHGHNFYELDIILDGKNKGKINRKEIEISKGDVFFLTPEDFHEYYEQGSLDILNIHFASDTISKEIFSKVVNSSLRHFHPSEKSFSEISRLGKLLYELFTDGSDKEILSRLVECLLLLLINETGSGELSIADKSEDIQKAIIYLSTHFKENPSLSTVAKTVPLNERYFCKKFKEYTGDNYKSYLRKMKLRYARRLIYATSYSMLEIAERSGYQTQSHFNREFKEMYGVTPSELRNE
jgi:AraC-like DNA-binding protein